MKSRLSKIGVALLAFSTPSQAQETPDLMLSTVTTVLTTSGFFPQFPLTNGRMPTDLLANALTAQVRRGAGEDAVQDASQIGSQSALDLIAETSCDNTVSALKDTFNIDYFLN